MKKENDVYRTFNKSQKGTGNSQAVLQSLIEKSDKEYVNLKNLQLKKIERVQQEEGKEKGPKKNEVVGDAIGNVSQLKSLFEGPAARQKALQESMKKVEAELEKGKAIAQESLAQADAQLDSLGQEPILKTEAELPERSSQEVVVGHAELSIEEKLALIEQKGYSGLQKTLEINQVKPNQLVTNLG